MTLSDTLRTVFAPPHRVGWPFIAGAAVVAVVAVAVGWTWLFWVGAVLCAFCFYFFRDPERVAPGRPGAVVAPADGRVISVAPVVPAAELGLGTEPRWRVATFLSVMDVHVNRVPVDGVVTRVSYRAGAFVSANLDKASDENERNALAIQMADGREVGVVQIAGLIARRIVCSVSAGEAVRAGGRFGIIRFGSRTDLYLPPGVVPLVVEGQTMIGGETVMAELAPAPVPAGGA